MNLCFDCGTIANNLTCLKKYHRKAEQECFEVSTTHKGKCDCCGNKKTVTEERDFFYPDENAIKLIKKYLNCKIIK